MRRFVLPVDRTAEQRKKLGEFTEEVNGKPYSMTPGKLLRRASKGKGDDMSKQYGYFCSELVAAALKTIGLLDRTRASSYFWPGSYNIGGEIERHLSPNVRLDDTLLVIDSKFAEVGQSILRNSSYQ